MGFWCPKFARLRNAFLRDTFNDSHTYVCCFHPFKTEKCMSSLFGFSLSPRLSPQLQKRKEREEQLEDVIQAYEKIHMEKSNLQRDLDKMVRDACYCAVALPRSRMVLCMSPDGGQCPNMADTECV